MKTKPVKILDWAMSEAVRLVQEAEAKRKECPFDEVETEEQTEGEEDERG